jgi:hypothetical protein
MVLKYLNRGAKVTENTLNRVYTNVWNGMMSDNRTFEQLKNDVKIYRKLLYKLLLPIDEMLYYLDRLHHGEEHIRDKILEDDLRGVDFNQMRIVRQEYLEREIAAKRAAAEEQIRFGRDPHHRKSIFTRETEIQMRTAHRNNDARREAARNIDTRPAAPVIDFSAHFHDMDPFHVHDETKKFREKVPMILNIIKNDLYPDSNPDKEQYINDRYINIKKVFDETLVKYIKENQEFESKAINSIQVNKPNGTRGPKILSRVEWLVDLNRIKQGVSDTYLEQKIQMGMIQVIILN